MLIQFSFIFGKWVLAQTTRLIYMFFSLGIGIREYGGAI